jgi:hypothetical protein
MVYFLEMISLRTPAAREPKRPPSWRIDVSQPVAVDDSTTVGKFSVNRCMTRDCPKTPCWYPYSNPPRLAGCQRFCQETDAGRGTYEAKNAMNKTLGLLLIESQMLALMLAAMAVDL